MKIEEFDFIQDLSIDPRFVVNQKDGLFKVKENNGFSASFTVNNDFNLTAFHFSKYRNQTPLFKIRLGVRQIYIDGVFASPIKLDLLNYDLFIGFFKQIKDMGLGDYLQHLSVLEDRFCTHEPPSFQSVNLFTDLLNK